MQGSYTNNGLPRPYYIKPNKRGSAYDKMPKQIFLTNSRKMVGYLVMLFFFGICVYMIGQELKPHTDVTYEIVSSANDAGSDKNLGNVGHLVDSGKGEDKPLEKLDLALNKAKNSKGELGHGVLEAPKGGIVNEAPNVGNDQDLVIDGRKKGPTDREKNGNDVKASRGDDNTVNDKPKQDKHLEATKEQKKKGAEDSSKESQAQPGSEDIAKVQKILEQS